MPKKYLDYDGLVVYDGLLKDLIDTKIDNSAMTVGDVDDIFDSVMFDNQISTTISSVNASLTNSLGGE